MIKMTDQELFFEVLKPGILKRFNVVTSEDKLAGRLIKSSPFEKQLNTNTIVTHWLEEFFIRESGIFQKLYDAKGGWLILDRSLDACIRFDRQMEFFDDLTQKARGQYRHHQKLL